MCRRSMRLPIDIISVSEFTQMTTGTKNAAAVRKAQADGREGRGRKPAPDPAAKLDKKEVKAATAYAAHAA